MKKKLYLLIYNYFFARIGDSLFLIKVKWYIALKLIGKDFHEQNISLNRERILKYTDKRFPILPEVNEVITKVDKEVIYLLDVGCGVVSKVGNFASGKIIVKTLFDPLAKEYSLLHKKFDFPDQPIIIKGYAEELDNFFPENYFNVIYARNCIDHCYDPLKVIGKMIKVLKRDNYIIMQHFVNEGERAKYFGLHQWNFNLQQSDFTISNRSGSICVNINKHFEKECDISSYILKEKVFCIIKKL